MKKGISINVAKLYVYQIRFCGKELKDVPKQYREYVRILLEAQDV